MAGVKWIRLSIGMFDNRKIKYLRSLPEGNNIILIWVMLLTVAGRCNAGGMIFLTENVPYTPKMLAQELDFEESIITLALNALQQLGMIEYYDEKLLIAGWEEHQNIDGLEKIREQNRVRKQKQRDKERLVLNDNVTGHVTVTQSHATEEELELEEDIDIYKDNRVDYQLIVDMYNNTCVSFPRLTKLSEKRKKAIKARLNVYSIDDLQRAFGKVQSSDFLKGANNRNWSATFDWIINDTNLAKILDGNYDKKEQVQQVKNPKPNKFNNFKQRQYTKEEFAEMERKLLNR